MTNIKKILFVMLLCGLMMFCATEALAATTQTAIGNVSEEIKVLAIEDGHWGLWPGIDDTTSSTVYDTDDDNDEAPPPPGDDDDDDDDNNNNYNDEPIIPTPTPEPEIQGTEKGEEEAPEQEHVYNPLLDNKHTINNILSSNAVNMYAIRTTSDSVSDRVDELTSADGAVVDSGWASVGGSKMSKSGSFKNEASTYEVGYDQLVKETSNKKQYVGFSLSYTRGSVKYNGMSGNGKERDETIALYTIDKYKHGQYLSFVGTAGRYSNSYDLWDSDGYNESAKNKTYGFSAGIGYGRKIHYTGGWYIDPHVNANFAYLAGNNYAISNGVDVENNGVSSLIGKVGINVGKYFGREKAGVIYAKAVFAREFLSDYKVTMDYRDTDTQIVTKGNVRENWFDYGIGVSYRLSDRDYLSLSVGKSTGEECYKDWIWNLGFKFSF